MTGDGEGNRGGQQRRLRKGDVVPGVRGAGREIVS